MIQARLLHLSLTAVALLLLTAALPAQDFAAAQETALRSLQSNPEAFNLSKQDVSDIRITDTYRTRHNGVTHVWVQQQHAGIPLYNALFGLHVKSDGSVLHLGHRFLPDLAQRVNTTLPSLGATRALELAAAELGTTPSTPPAVQRKINDRHWIFEGGALAQKPIPVMSVYDLDAAGQPRLAWLMHIAQAGSVDYWTISVDAQTGAVLRRYNNTVYCIAGHPHTVGETCETPIAASGQRQDTKSGIRGETGAGDLYNVFPLPVESPNYGVRSLVIDPADPLASPFGWHDDNGAPGAEYNYTRGNNVWAYEDIANDNVPAIDESADGGPNRHFDFPFDPTAEPEENLSASITNLFYVNNMIHDIAYRFGFDEPAGNYQMNNYGNGGMDSDPVLAQALDGSDENNAGFVQGPDGDPGQMLMYRWGQRGGLVQVNGPAAVLGVYEASASNSGGNSGWGAQVTTAAVTGEAVLVDDGSGSPDAHLNCTPPVNNLQGKIAIVDRGICQFGQKALIAEQAGAIGCIICNYEDAYLNMAAGDFGNDVTIPVVQMTKSDCDRLRVFAGNGLNISLVQQASSGPDFVDAGFDNGVILHEYAHGISSRLTGGPGEFGCLSNTENMGEGWSDFFALALTAKAGDAPEQNRPVATYLYRQGPDGRGLRRFPYSTDMSVNPLTFANVADNPQTHALGEVWCAALWDLYWALVEQYGFDPDLTNPNSGNARAIQLVMDGMKLQPCLPGFIDGRNAILAADILNYNGVDTCLISSVFARRGLGYRASQGSNLSPSDGVENFDPIPTCIKELKIEKIANTPLIQGGAEASFTLVVRNHKDETAPAVTVTDPLPPGWSLVSATSGGFNDNGTLTWNLGDLAPGQELALHYTALSDPNTYSQSYFRDIMDSEGDSWASYSILSSVFDAFFLQDDSVKVGDLAWKAAGNINYVTDQVLFHYVPVSVSGAKPVMRLWHNYNTEAGADAGMLEIQVVGESVWRRLAPEKVFRGSYPARVQYGTFSIPFLSGFSGNSNGWVQSYFDLGEFAGKQILFQFRYGTDDNTAVINGGWWVDEVEIMDMINYENEACVRSSAGDLACDSAPAGGVIMDTSAVPVGTDEPAAPGLRLAVTPNPATELLTVRFDESSEGPVRLRLLGADGRILILRTLPPVQEGQSLLLNVNSLPPGLYVVQVESDRRVTSVKVAVGR